MSTITESYEDVAVLEKTETAPKLVVLNDDYNTFQHVIECLIKYVKCNEVQAEQLAILIHYKGQAVVKTSTMEVLVPMKEALLSEGIDAIIETD